LDATQSGEDLRLSSLPLTLTYGGRSAVGDLSGCRLYDSGVSLNDSTVVNTSSHTSTSSPAAQSSTFTFDQSLVIPKGTVKTLGLKCLVSSNALSSASYSWGITTTQIAALNLTGTFSSQDVDATGSTMAGQAQTIGAGSLAVSLDASSPSYTIVPADTEGVTVAVLKFRASNENVTLQKIGLTLTNTASSSADDLTKVTLWDGATQVGDAYFTGTNTTATSSALNLTMTKDTDKTLIVKANLAKIAQSEATKVSGHLLAVDYLNGEGVGADSGNTITTTGSSAVAGVRIMKSYPTLALEESTEKKLASSGISDGKLMRFKVTANAKGPISIGKFEFNVATVTASVTNINLFGYTDAAYSQGISGVSSGGQIEDANYNPTSNSSTFAIYPRTSANASTTIQVPAGATYYFELRGTVTGVTTGASVTTTLNGDSAYPVLSTHMGALEASVDTGSTLNSFLWSPNSTSTPVVADQDWTNGYGLMGLPASGIIQTRSAN